MDKFKATQDHRGLDQTVMTDGCMFHHLCQTNLN